MIAWEAIAPAVGRFLIMLPPGLAQRLQVGSIRHLREDVAHGDRKGHRPVDDLRRGQSTGSTIVLALPPATTASG